MAFNLKKLVEGVTAQVNPFDNGKTFATVQKQQPAQTPSPVEQKIQTAKYGVLANNPQKQQQFIQSIKPTRFDPLKAGASVGADIVRGVAKPFQQTGNMAVYGGKAANSLIDIAQKQKTPAQATADLERYSRSRGTFGAGLPKSFQGVEQGSKGFIEDPSKARSSVGTGAELASNAIPVGRGISVAAQGAKAVPRLAVESGAVGAVGSAGAQYAETGKVNPTRLVQDTAVSAALGVAPSALLAGAKKGIGKVTVTPKLTPEQLAERNNWVTKRATAEITKPGVVPYIDRKIAEIDATTNPRLKLPFKPINNQIGAVGRNVLPDPLEALKVEARKYKSAEEFVKDKFTVHATDADIQGNIRPSMGWYGKGVYTTTDMANPLGRKGSSNQYFVPKPTDKFLQIEAIGPNGRGGITPKQVDEAIANGYKGLEIVHPNGKRTWYNYFDEQTPYTKQQLTDLYNQATQKKPLFKPLNQGGYVKNPLGKEPKPNAVNEYADMLQSMESSLKGGQMIGDSTNGYTRISEHTPFYRDFYARNGKAPTKADWQAEAERQLKAGKAEGEFQKAYNDQTNPEVASLLQEADKGALKPNGVVISEAVNKGSGTKVQRGLEVVNGKPQRFERTVASNKLESIANKELPNVSEKPVDLKSIDGRENAPIKQKFLDLTNKYLGNQKAGAFNAVDRAKKFNEQFGNLTEKQKNEVIFATDDSKFTTKDPAVQRAVDYLRAEFDSAYRLFTEDKGLKLGYQESYYPRQYVNKKTGEEISAAQYNLLQKSSGRQRGRTASDLQEWKLVTRDPAEALVKYYTSLEKAAAGQKYLRGLQDNGLVISSSEPVRGMQPVIAEGMQENGMIYYAKPEVAKQLNRLFGSEKASGFFEKSLEKAQGVNSFMQSFVLSGGVPNTPLNAFGVMQFMKNAMALHPIQGGKAFYLGMTRKGADKFFEKNQSYIQKMTQNGLDVRYDYRPQMKSAKADIATAFKDKGTAKAIAVGWDELTNDATFGRFMPALETLHFKGVYNKLVKTMPEAEAAKTAAKATANFFGKNTLAKDATRSKVANDASGALLFAPRFRESMLNFWVKNAQALKPGNITKPEYRDNVKFMAAAALTYGVMDGVNYAENGVHMYQNPDGKKDKLLIPGKDGQYVGIPFLPSIATVPRNAGMGIYNLAAGNLNEAGKNAKSFLSIPARAVGDIVTNENYFGAPIVQKGATAGERAAQVGSYLVKNNLQPWIREGLNAAGQNLPDETKKMLGIKKQTGVQTASQALELPFRFYDSQNFKGGADNFKTADGSTLGDTRTASADTRDEIMKAALNTPEAKRFFANSDAKQQELADNDPELQKLYDQRKAMLTGLKSNKVVSNNKLTNKEQSAVNSWNRLTTEAKNKIAKENPARKKEYELANAKLQFSMGEIDQEAYDKKIATLTKAKKTSSGGRRSSGSRSGSKSTYSFAKVNSRRKSSSDSLRKLLGMAKI